MMTERHPGIASLAVAAIGNQGMAERWMNARSQLFGGRTPLEALEHPEGHRRVTRQLQWFAGPSRRPQKAFAWDNSAWDDSRSVVIGRRP